MGERLIRRDVKLPAGTKLSVRFVVEFDVPLDEDLLQDETAATLDEVEKWLEAGAYASDRLWLAVARSYDRNVIEHTWHPTSSGREVRFELPWEQEMREGKRTLGLKPRVYVEFSELAELV